MNLEESLQSMFGHGQFRDGQREAIEVLMEGRSVLAVFPTGGGKSLCYQLPAMLFEGMTLVVSPLIALMKDQVEAMHRKNLSAARLDSTLEADEVQEIYRQMAAGELKLLYVAPERLANEGFMRRLRGVNISMLAVDEAHCISEWGHNFRPDYLKLALTAEELKVERILALTATATPRVSADIRKRFSIAESDHIQTGFTRANLSFHVTPCSLEEKEEVLVNRLREHEGGAAVVYVTLQRTAEEVAGALSRNGIPSRAYHAGMRDDHRSEVQDGFMDGSIQTVVATIAFGMGIDKSDIRSVFHYNLPKSLENYVQESGRSGRDGQPAHCEILACLDDLIVLENFVYGDTPSPTALKSLVENVVLQGSRFSVSRYDLSISKDMRPLVISTALTYLELDGVLIPRGPFYAGYRFKFIEPVERILGGHEPERRDFLKKIFDACEKKRIWYTIDITEVALKIGEDESRIRKAFGHLEKMGEVQLRPSGLRHGYELNEKAEQSVSVLTDRLVELFQSRESGEIDRLGLVVNLCESGECIPQQILSYFGEKSEPCGTCSSCLGTRGADTLPRTRRGEITPEHIETMQEIIREKHSALRQPRQLARFVCGLSSPATTRKRMSRDERFGIVAEVPFQDVLTQAESMLSSW